MIAVNGCRLPIRNQWCSDSALLGGMCQAPNWEVLVPYELVLDNIDGDRQRWFVVGQACVPVGEGRLQLPKVDQALEVDGAAFREVVGLYSGLFGSSNRVHSAQQHDPYLVQADGDLAHGLAGFAHE